MTQIAPDSGVAEGELLPCPFCGGDAEFRTGTAPNVHVQCTRCGIKRVQKFYRMTREQLREAMVEAWNKREDATIASLQREAEGLRRENGWVESLLDTLEAIAKLDQSAYTLSIAKSVAMNAINSYRVAHPDSETQG